MPEPEEKKPEEKKSEEWRNVEEVKKIIQDRDRFKQLTHELNEKLSEFEDLKNKVASFEEEKAKAEDEIKRKKLEEKGEYQKIIESNRSKYEQEKADMIRRFNNAVLPAKLRDAALKVENVLPSAVDHIIAATRDRFGINENFEVYVRNDDGKVLLGDDGKPVAVESFMSKFISEAPHFQADRQPTNKGLKPGDQGGFHQTKSLAEMSDQERAEFRKADEKGYQQAIQQAMSPQSQREAAIKIIQEKKSLMDKLGGNPLGK